MTPTEFIVYSCLVCCAGRKGFCWPGCKTIGDAIGRSRKSVVKYVSALEDKGLIKTETTMTDSFSSPTYGRAQTLRELTSSI